MTETIVTAHFAITGWDEQAYDEPADGPVLARATVRKRFTGPLEGTSVTELLTAVGPDGRGYVATERVTGVLDGRAGTFVLQHGGIDDGAGQTAFGTIVAGSGTGELRGVRGAARYTHTGDEATLRLAYTLG